MSVSRRMPFLPVATRHNAVHVLDFTLNVAGIWQTSEIIYLFKLKDQNTSGVQIHKHVFLFKKPQQYFDWNIATLMAEQSWIKKACLKKQQKNPPKTLKIKYIPVRSEALNFLPAWSHDVVQNFHAAAPEPGAGAGCVCLCSCFHLGFP